MRLHLTPSPSHAHPHTHTEAGVHLRPGAAGVAAAPPDGMQHAVFAHFFSRCVPRLFLTTPFIASTERRGEPVGAREAGHPCARRHHAGHDAAGRDCAHGRPSGHPGRLPPRRPAGADCAAAARQRALQEARGDGHRQGAEGADPARRRAQRDDRLHYHPRAGMCQSETHIPLSPLFPTYTHPHTYPCLPYRWSRTTRRSRTTRSC